MEELKTAMDQWMKTLENPREQADRWVNEHYNFYPHSIKLHLALAYMAGSHNGLKEGQEILVETAKILGLHLSEEAVTAAAITLEGFGMRKVENNG